LQNDVDAAGNRGHRSENNYNERASPGQRYKEEDKKHFPSDY